MSRFAIAGVVAVMFFAGSAAADPIRVHVVKDAKSFKVPKADSVRVVCDAPEGTTFATKLEGSGKLDRTSDVSETADGTTKAGTGRMEYEIKPTGKGMVRFTVTAKGPNEATPKVTVFEFEVTD
ncbi:MAG: hypothetical protein JWO38_3158 [Gemmataceae bacterium]|nr:hypothetical protein [Gemmataceae bacterium]